MSTPITNIPINPQPTKIEEDPEVTAMLKEMQPPPQVPPVQGQAQMAAVSPPLPPPVAYQQRAQVVVAKKPYLDYDILYKALYAVVIAYIIFYPEIGFIYQKFPILDNFKTYEFISRAIVFGVVLYFIMWKFYSD